MVVIGKFRVENGKLSGAETFFGVNVWKRSSDIWRSGKCYFTKIPCIYIYILLKNMQHTYFLTWCGLNLPQESHTLRVTVVRPSPRSARTFCLYLLHTLFRSLSSFPPISPTNLYFTPIQVYPNISPSDLFLPIVLSPLFSFFCQRYLTYIYIIYACEFCIYG